MVFYLISLLALAGDQFSKWWVRGHLVMGQESTVWGGLVHIIRLENTGAAGSSFEGYGRWFVPVAVLIVAIVLYYRSRGKLRGFWMELGTGLFVGGAIGNAIDRVAFNGVTDFIQLKGRGGVMNVADICLNVGMVLLLLATFFSRRKRNAASPAERPEPAAE